MKLTGGRHFMDVNYDAKCSLDGKLQSLKTDLCLECGFSDDLSGFVLMSVNRSLTQTYKVDNCLSVTTGAHTNTPSKTAVRGPGEIQAGCIIETIIDHISAATGLSQHEVRKVNMIKATREETGLQAPCGDNMYEYTTWELWQQLEKQANFTERHAEVLRLNSIPQCEQGSIWPKKRGIAMTPLKYHHSVGMRTATVSVYSDGTVLISGPGVEIGQGLFTKSLQAASYALSQVAILLPSPYPKPDLNSIHVLRLVFLYRWSSSDMQTQTQRWCL